MADMRRRDAGPPAGMPRVEFKPGMANELLRELAPLLAEEGIDVANIDVPDIDTLQRAINRAVERKNMELFTPVGATRDIAVRALRGVVEAILNGDTRLAAGRLDLVQPESPVSTVATVASCIGISLGLLDDWLSAPDSNGLGARTTLPAGHWNGDRRDGHPRPRPQEQVLPLAGQTARPTRRPTGPRRLRTRPHRSDHHTSA